MKSLLGLFCLFISLGSMLLGSSVYANNNVKCDFIKRERCSDCAAIVKLSCGPIEGYVLNTTEIDSLTFLIKNEENQTQRLVTIDNLGKIRNFSFEFGLERILRDREIIFGYYEKVSIAEGGVNIANTTKMYGSMFGAHFDNAPLSTVSEALAKNPEMECAYVKNPLVAVDLSGKMQTSCFGEVRCKTGSDKSHIIQVSCHASGKAGFEVCPSAIECATSEDTLLIKSTR